MKMRKFADEGFVREGRNENIDDDTRARARKFVEDNAAPAKPKVVTKEELKGMSLRDYMNQQQGLTRRGSPAPTRIDPDESAMETRRNARSGRPDQLAGESARNARSGRPDQLAGESARNARSGNPDAYGKASTSQASGPMSREDLIAQIPTGGSGAGPTPSEGSSASGSELGRNVSNTLNAVAGLKGVQIGQMAAEAAMGSRAEKAMSAASAAKKAQLAGELRRGATPTKFTSPSKTAANRDTRFRDDAVGVEYRKGGAAKGYASGGSVSSRADGIAQRGKTRGRMC